MSRGNILLVIGDAAEGLDAVEADPVRLTRAVASIRAAFP